MYDSDNAADIPADAKIAAGYVDGSGTYPTLVRIRPRAKHLSISIHGAQAKCYDMETGALSIREGVACAKRDIKAGRSWPWLYYSVSSRPAVDAELKRQGITGKVIHWGAHYLQPDVVPHGYHALQNRAPGYGATGHWDRSVLVPYIPGFDPKPAPAAKTWYRRVLRRGMTGSDVVALKRRLRAHGYRGFAVWVPLFGRGCEAAVRAFQRAHHLTVDGVVGPVTAQALG